MNYRTSYFALIPEALKVIIIIGMFTFWVKLLRILNTKLTIDEKIVSGKTGILNIETLDSPINKITSVKVEQGIFGRIFNFGNVYINTPSGNFIFECMNKPNEIKRDLLNKINNQ